MSVYNQIFLENNKNGVGQKISPSALSKSGPVIAVEISIPKALADEFAKKNQPIPSPVSGLALIDTGATMSCVDDDVITKLGVSPIGQTTISGSNGSHTVNTYPSHFRFPAISGFEIDFTSTVGIDLQVQKVGNQPIVALLGRDVLSKCVLVYNGHLGMYTLTF